MPPREGPTMAYISKMVDDEKVDGAEKKNMWVVLQRSVKKFHFGSWEEKEMAAMEIKNIAKQGTKNKKFLAELGIIPPLVAMVGSEVVGRQRLAVQTLLQLANATYTNKAIMVEAGILSKLPESMGDFDESTKHEFSGLLLLISSLAITKYPISSTKILPFIFSILESDHSSETKELCLGTLYNLSTILENSENMVTCGVVDTLLRMSTTKNTSEKSLATLGNLVITQTGRKVLENNVMVPECFIEIMTWEENPKCQEFSAYILMILANHSSAQRLKMANTGIVSVILEVALLGSPLAQKRALKLLQLFKDEKQMKMRSHSGPQTGRISICSPVNPREGKRLMKNMVEQSLNKNMETISRRANGVKVFGGTLSSKSLPY